MAKWLEREVASGLMGLIALRLDGAPAADTVSATLDIWLVALSKGREWDEQEDAVRIQKAFEVLFASCERWPAPARLLRELPSREPVKSLPKPKRSDKQIETGNAALDGIVAGIRRGTRARQTKTERQIDADKVGAEAVFDHLQREALISKTMEQTNK